MSIMHSAAATMPRQTPTGFSPTISGRIDANGIVVYGNDVDFAIFPADASAGDRAAIWVIQTSTNCFIRVGRWISGNGDTWYNTVGVSQGDPGLYTGTGTTVFELGEQCDSVNIYNSNDNTTDAPSAQGSVTYIAIGSYTSDDKTTFFAPTQDTKYGRQVYAQETETGIGFNTAVGEVTVQFTFRKSGYDDYTITFRGRARANADVEP